MPDNGNELEAPIITILQESQHVLTEVSALCALFLRVYELIKVKFSLRPYFGGNFEGFKKSLSNYLSL